MARNTRNYSDLNLLFTRHPLSGDVTKKQDEEAVRAALRNLISTRHYERPFHPEIGCQIHSLLFENFTPVTVQVMKKSVFDVIEKFEPRATVLDVRIRDVPDENRIDLDIIFRLNNSERPITLSTFLTRVR
jgi:phage baseplate assembly protein W